MKDCTTLRQAQGTPFDRPFDSPSAALRQAQRKAQGKSSGDVCGAGCVLGLTPDLQQTPEELDRLHQAVLQLDVRVPAHLLAGQGDVRLALHRVVGGQRFEDQFGFRAGHLHHLLRQFPDREFHRVAEVDRAEEVVIGIHQANEGLDQVVDIAERTGLLSFAIDGDRLVLQGLHDEVRHHPAVVGVHPRAVGIEDPADLDPQFVLAVVVEEQGFGTALALVIAGAGAGGVDVAPVALRLRVDIGVAVDLAGRGLEDLRPDPFGQAEHVDGAMDAGLGGLHRVVLVVDRRGRAGQVVDLVDLDVQRKGDVVAQQLEMGVVQQVEDVVLGAGEVVIDTEDVVPVVEEAFTEMGAEKAGPAGHQYAFCGM